MKQTIRYLIALVVSIAILNSCRQEVKMQRYSDEKTGFSIEYPETWKPVSNEEKAHHREQGTDIITEMVPDSLKDQTEQEIKAAEINTLVSIKKNEFTFFEVTAQPYDSSMVYKEQQDFMFDMVVQAYEAKGMSVEHVRSTGEIDGLEFQKFEIKIFDRDKNKVILKQVLYDRLIDGRFSMLLGCTYVEDEDGETFKKMLASAKFKYRN